jgi:hypothetical protein
VLTEKTPEPDKGRGKVQGIGITGFQGTFDLESLFHTMTVIGIAT